MWRTELNDLVNGGRAWAFIGSGISINAGYPSWKGLIEKILSIIDSVRRANIEKDSSYVSSFQKQNYAKCLERIEHHIDRKSLEDIVRKILDLTTSRADLATLVSEWPFEGYITTNYDNLLQKTLQKLGQHGWSLVGNSDSEIRKISGDPKQVIWHIHGSIALPPERSKLVLTEKDYDDLYLMESPVIKQLKGLLEQRRVVFIGFGFADPEIVRLLKLVGRFSSPARPAFAFLGEADDSQNTYEMLEKYNVDVIPYRIENGSHRNLTELLEAYSALILRRSQKFGQPDRPCPSYDPETTGILLYNSLALRGDSQLNEDVLGALLRAHSVLAQV